MKPLRMEGEGGEEKEEQEKGEENEENEIKCVIKNPRLNKNKSIRLMRLKPG